MDASILTGDSEPNRHLPQEEDSQTKLVLPEEKFG